MRDNSSRNGNSANWKRRSILKTAGLGAGLSFTKKNASEQVLFDYAPHNAFETTQQFSPGTHTLTVNIPKVTEENLKKLCEASRDSKRHHPLRHVKPDHSDGHRQC